MFQQSARLLFSDAGDEDRAEELLRVVGFSDPAKARTRLRGLCHDAACQRALAESLPMLLGALSETALPDASLVNFERYVQAVASREELFRFLAERPRAVEILVKLFVGSQFLTEILLKNPDYLQQLTHHKRLAEFKYREQFYEEARAAAIQSEQPGERFEAIRRYQKWELLRIGACDSFGLFDLKNVTLQLSLLAEGLVEACLQLLAADKGGASLSLDRFCVLAFGKLGGEELNYSSDIDLVFLTEGESRPYWELGQKLIQALIESTGEGFLYRVDMRLRPWGRSGALVNSTDAHLAYLKKHGRLWEKQALLKARPIAGNSGVGADFLRRAEPLIFGMPAEDILESVRAMKRGIEKKLGRKGQLWGEVKGGPGSIRDIEFLTQCLQLIHGALQPAVRGVGTLDGLVRLADLGIIGADEYRVLSGGYNFLRTIEHSLQLVHYKQVHALPHDRRELAYLARRLDYPSGEQFLAQYERTIQAVRAVYDKYLGGSPEDDSDSSSRPARSDHARRMARSYGTIFTDEEIARHGQLLSRLGAGNLVELSVRAADSESEARRWTVTVAGRDHRGDLTMICGLFVVFGLDIIDGYVFTELPGRRGASDRGGGEFLDVFTVRAVGGGPEDLWDRYERELESLIQLVADGKPGEAHGRLARRVADAVLPRPAEGPEAASAAADLLPVDVQIDNEQSPLFTVLQIRGSDTVGFLYELTSALALSGFNIGRVVINSTAEQVFDTLSITDHQGSKIRDEAAQQRLRTAIVLIKHFTHLLPSSPNPEAALLHFRDFLGELFRQEDWPEQVASLDRREVLGALGRLLGVSDFLWEDFLRLQYANLVPVLTDIETLTRPTSRIVLEAQLAAVLQSAHDRAVAVRALNTFKDREMFRIDLRHILGYAEDVEDFSNELTDLAETIVRGAVWLVRRELTERFGTPRRNSPGNGDGEEVPLAVCALGKCGGRELGFASDIELMFLYEGDGRTDGSEPIRAAEFYQRFVERFTHTITARQEGLFQIDLRLRPYGQAGSLAVTTEAFENYFGPGSGKAAWPYERQALVKLRPIGGDQAFGQRIVALRDRLIYTGEPFDTVSMRAMREKQVRQLVQPGTFNAKLSPGGLVDAEYLVQGLQITYGGENPQLRSTNTLEAVDALDEAGLLDNQAAALRRAYDFLRRLIDALRIVRGHAKDLAVPAPDQDEFELLARRLGAETDPEQLSREIEKHTQAVLSLQGLLPRMGGCPNTSMGLKK